MVEVLPESIPVLVTWPTRKIGTPCRLATCSRAVAHSLTCKPGACLGPPYIMHSMKVLSDKTSTYTAFVLGSSRCAVTTCNVSLKFDLGHAASGAGDIIQIHSLDGVDDNSAGLHGNNFLQDVHEARGTV